MHLIPELDSADVKFDVYTVMWHYWRDPILFGLKKTPYLHFGDSVERMPATKLRNMNMLLVVARHFIKIDSKNTKKTKKQNKTKQNTKLSSQV